MLEIQERLLLGYLRPVEFQSQWQAQQIAELTHFNQQVLYKEFWAQYIIPI
jgi:hypothetical protein